MSKSVVETVRITCSSGAHGQWWLAGRDPETGRWTISPDIHGRFAADPAGRGRWVFRCDSCGNSLPVRADNDKFQTILTQIHDAGLSTVTIKGLIAIVVKH